MHVFVYFLYIFNLLIFYIGGHIPPMYIFAGKRMKMEWLDGSVPGAKLAMSDSSNINGLLFLPLDSVVCDMFNSRLTTTAYS